MSERIDAIKQAVEKTEKCRATHVESVVVRDKYEGETVWEGVVETFQLHEHPRAKRAYAWRRRQGSGEKREDEFTVVIGVPPINSAQDAVRAAIVALYRSL